MTRPHESTAERGAALRPQGDGGGELPRLRDLPPGQDLVGVSELVRAAMPAPELPAVVRQHLRARLRRSLGSGARRRPRWWAVLRPSLVVLAALMSASVGGAAVYSVIVERRVAKHVAEEMTGWSARVGEKERPARRRRAPVAQQQEQEREQDQTQTQTQEQEQEQAQDQMQQQAQGQNETAPPVGVAPPPASPSPGAAPSPSSLFPPALSPRPSSPPAAAASRASSPRPSAVMVARARQSVAVPPPERPEKGAPLQPLQAVVEPALSPPPLNAPSIVPPPSPALPRAAAPSSSPSTRPMVAMASPPPSSSSAHRAIPPAPSPVASRGPAHVPAPSVPAPSVPAPSVPARPETEFLADALRRLRTNGDPDAALAALDEATARFPGSTLAPEVSAVRVEALLKARRPSAALAELDRMPLDGTPGHDAWLVVRGELRSEKGRWREAEADFARALATRLDGARDALAERALWGRANARARLGDAAGAREICAVYVRRFPGGRFVEAVGRLSRQLPSAGAP